MRTNWSEKEIAILNQYSAGKKSPYQLYIEIKSLGNHSVKRTYDSVVSKINRMLRNGELLIPKKETVVTKQLKIGYWDIEATDLGADFGRMISWCIKTRDKKEYVYDIVRPNEITRYKCKSDKRIVQSFIKAVQKYDLICSYNGTNFDIPFTRTRAIAHGLTFIPFGQVAHKDIYYIAKSKLKLRSKRLAVVAQLMNVNEKTSLEPEIWQNASLGDKRALQYILKHNIKDCDTLEKVHKRLEIYAKTINKSI